MTWCQWQQLTPTSPGLLVSRGRRPPATTVEERLLPALPGTPAPVLPSTCLAGLIITTHSFSRRPPVSAGCQALRPQAGGEGEEVRGSKGCAGGKHWGTEGGFPEPAVPAQSPGGQGARAASPLQGGQAEGGVPQDGQRLRRDKGPRAGRGCCPCCGQAAGTTW